MFSHQRRLHAGKNDPFLHGEKPEVKICPKFWAGGFLVKTPADFDAYFCIGGFNLVLEDTNRTKQTESAVYQI